MGAILGLLPATGTRGEKIMTELNQANREVAEKLGLCWHEPQFVTLGRVTKHKCAKCHKVVKHVDFNPDFSTDAGKVQLMKLMMKREDYLTFCRYSECQIDNQTNEVFWSERYILDTTGLLVKAAIKFLEEGI